MMPLTLSMTQFSLPLAMNFDKSLGSVLKVSILHIHSTKRHLIKRYYSLVRKIFADAKCIRHALEGQGSVTLQKLCIGNYSHFTNIVTDVCREISWRSQVRGFNVGYYTSITCQSWMNLLTFIQ
jgi:hypothetical protein